MKWNRAWRRPIAGIWEGAVSSADARRKRGAWSSAPEGCRAFGRAQSQRGQARRTGHLCARPAAGRKNLLIPEPDTVAEPPSGAEDRHRRGARAAAGSDPRQPADGRDAAEVELPPGGETTAGRSGREKPNYCSRSCSCASVKPLRRRNGEPLTPRGSLGLTADKPALRDAAEHAAARPGPRAGDGDHVTACSTGA